MPKINAESLQAHVLRQRDRVLDVAFAIFEQEGVDAATMERIAADSGLARNSLYKYFPDRHRMLFESVMWRIENLLAASRDTIQKHPSPVERVLAWVEAVAEFCGGAEQRLLQLAGVLPIPHSELRRRIQLAHVRMLEQLRSDFAEALAGSRLDPQLWVVIFEVTARAAGQYGHDHGDLPRAVRECRMVCHGFFLTRYTPTGIRVLQP